MKAWLFVGAKVVWVRSLGGPRLPMGERPIAGAPYTVRGLRVSPCGEIGIQLEGLNNAGYPAPYAHIEMDFDARCFEPISTIDTTAAVAKLARLTIPAGRKVDA